jgi:hypothetical protein
MSSAAAEKASMPAGAGPDVFFRTEKERAEALLNMQKDLLNMQKELFDAC